MIKILFLGGSKQQVPAIQYAISKNYFTILCDYLPNNPGRYIADKYYCESTTDLKKILKIAQSESIDGIVSYASDPAALTAAYVGNIMGLPSNPYKSIEILSKKNLFRKFLIENNINTPQSISYPDIKSFYNNLFKLNFPVIIKPTDSSGSKGVYKINTFEEFSYYYPQTLNASKEKRVIVEEYIENDKSYVIGGDIFILNGQVKFWGFLNSFRNFKENSLIPIGTSYPSLLSESEIFRLKKEISYIVQKLKLSFGAFNIEYFVKKDGNFQIIELGPRNGGNMIPDLLELATGVNTIAATVESSIGNMDFSLQQTRHVRYLSTFVVHSNQQGILQNIIIDNSIKPKIIRTILYKNVGDFIERFNGSNQAIAMLFIQFNNAYEVSDFMQNSSHLIKVIVS